MCVLADGIADHELRMTAKGVATDDEQLEQQNGKCEGVVMRRADKACEGLSLQFGGDVILNPHAGRPIGPVADLHTVAINNQNRAVVPDQEILAVDIANDDTSLMETCDGTGEVLGNLHHLYVGQSRHHGEPGFWCQQQV